jgi:hypothetical protein
MRLLYRKYWAGLKGTLYLRKYSPTDKPDEAIFSIVARIASTESALVRPDALIHLSINRAKKNVQHAWPGFRLVMHLGNLMSKYQTTKTALFIEEKSAPGRNRSPGSCDYLAHFQLFIMRSFK